MLEQLVVTAIEADAVQLRLGTLLRQVRAALALASGQVHDQLQEPSLEIAEQAEHGLERALDLLGLPDGQDDDTPGSAYREFRDDLARLEALRGGRFEVSATGKASLHARNLIGAKFGPLRADAQRKSDGLIGEAMAARRDVSGDEFTAHVYDTNALNATAEEVTRQFADYLNQQAALVVEDARADIGWVTMESTTVAGSTGKVLARVGYGGLLSRGAGVAVTAMITTAVLNVWNPVGWVLGVASAVGAAVSIVGRLLSRRAAREAEKKREQALGQSRANARVAVNATFESLQAELSRQITADLRNELTERARTAVRRALLLREIAAYTQRCRSEIEGFRKTLKATGNPAATLRDAVSTCETAASLGSRGPAALWLGEAWCDDPDLELALATAVAGRTGQISRPRYTQQLRLDLQAALASAAATPASGAGQQWLQWVQETLAEDPTARASLRELVDLGRTSRPRVVICGDYDTGKTSFIRRLLLDAGQPVPDSLTISARPETGAPAEYEWNGCTLVDVPGFQSGNDAHTAVARAAVPDAALVIYLFSPNLIVGDQDDISFVLAGDPACEIIGKLDRTVCVVNRSDTFGPDPEDDPDGFSLARRAEGDGARRRPYGALRADASRCRSAADQDGVHGERASWPAPGYPARRRPIPGVGRFPGIRTAIYGDLPGAGGQRYRRVRLARRALAPR